MTTTLRCTTYVQHMCKILWYSIIISASFLVTPMSLLLCDLKMLACLSVFSSCTWPLKDRSNEADIEDEGPDQGAADQDAHA